MSKNNDIAFENDKSDPLERRFDPGPLADAIEISEMEERLNARAAALLDGFDELRVKQEADEQEDKRLSQAESELAKRDARLRARKEQLDAIESELRAREKELKARDARRKQIILRLPESLWRDIADWAEDDFRSINSQIEYILTKSVKEHKGK